MYVITEALPKKFHFLATWFAFAGCIGCLPLFQVNQLVSLLQSQLMVVSFAESYYFNICLGLLVGLTYLIIKDGLASIAATTSKLVPMMVIIYFIIGLIILLKNIAIVPGLIIMIFKSAFNPSAAIGGGLAVVMLQGIKRGAFSNEAGIGTEALAHGTAKTKTDQRRLSSHDRALVRHIDYMYFNWINNINCYTTIIPGWLNRHSINFSCNKNFIGRCFLLDLFYLCTCILIFNLSGVFILQF